MSAIQAYLSQLAWRDYLVAAVDILIVYYVVYRALLLIKGTRAAQMLVGLVLVGAGFFLAKVLELSTLTWLLDNLINYSIIFLIVIFQSDIRRGLMRVGANLRGGRRSYEETSVFEEVVKAAERLAHARVGALIVLEREADLVEYLNEPGEELDAKVSQELLVSLFIPDSENELHDGAVIIKNLRIAQAGAVLPLSGNPKIDKALGTRHRAAIGVTEETDAVVVVVSEERGNISLCFGGNIARDLDGATLRKALLGLFRKEKPRRWGRRAPEAKKGAPAELPVKMESPLVEREPTGAQPAKEGEARPAEEKAQEREGSGKVAEALAGSEGR